MLEGILTMVIGLAALWGARYDPADPRTSCIYVPPVSNVFWYGIPGVLLLGIGLIWTLAKV